MEMLLADLERAFGKHNRFTWPNGRIDFALSGYTTIHSDTIAALSALSEAYTIEFRADYDANLDLVLTPNMKGD